MSRAATEQPWNGETVGDDALEIDAPPTHDAVLLPVGADLDDLRQFGSLFSRQARRYAAHPVVLQAIQACRIEAVDPVAQRLAVHVADRGGLGAALAVEDGRQRKQSSAAVGVLGLLGQAPKLCGRKIRPQSHRCRHGVVPWRESPRAKGISIAPKGNPT